MLKYYKDTGGRIQELREYEPGCWVNAVAPEEAEIALLIDNYGVELDFLRSALDEEESSHIDIDDGCALIIIDVPVVKKEQKGISYHTMPLGIITTGKCVITVSLRESTVIGEFTSGALRGISTEYRSQFVLNIILRVALKYLQYLKQIDKLSDQIEIQLQKSMKNKELLQLMEINKSLVYFSTSLKSNEATISKIARGRVIKIYSQDEELIDDVMIEIKQAIEMAYIRVNILSGTMDSFASLISNNLNVVMKVLASITLVSSVPTIVSSIYGMNVKYLPFTEMQYWWFPIIVTVGIIGLLMYFLRRKNLM